jgi:hypothetical protein
MMTVVTRFCSQHRPVGADDTARAEALRALAPLTERERAMFALSLLHEVRSPVLCGLMGFISEQVKQHGVRLFAAATQKH